MTKPTTVRLEQDLLDDLTIVARVRGTSVSDLLRAEARKVVEAAQQDPQFGRAALAVVERERERVNALAVAADRFVTVGP